MENKSKQNVKIKLLKTEPRYGLRRGEVLDLEILERKNRTTIFLDPPLVLYNFII